MLEDAERLKRPVSDDAGLHFKDAGIVLVDLDRP